jgi:hypothetical protein
MSRKLLLAKEIRILIRNLSEVIEKKKLKRDWR